jgi:3-hydroxyisobutyrate dehydrogenase-like beta-hydroxyacid dehydrogenase
MAGLILRAGYPLTVFSRNRASGAQLVAQGAREATSIGQCARASDVVFSSVSDDAALLEVALGAQGVLAHLGVGKIFADASTVSAEASQTVAEEANRRRVAYLRIPISGNAASALRGDVTVLASGPEAAWLELKPVAETFSKAQVYLGAGEEARYMKLVVNVLVVNLAQAMAEALALGRKSGLDWALMLDTIGQSTLASPWLKAKVALMKARDFSPTMTARLILKDMDLMLAAARGSGVTMPLTAVTRQLMQATVGEGYGDEDYMAAIKLIEKQSGLSPDSEVN